MCGFVDICPYDDAENDQDTRRQSNPCESVDSCPIIAYSNDLDGDGLCDSDDDDLPRG